MDAIALAEHALGVPQLILAVPPPVPVGFEPVFVELVRRREAREPLQHIVGYAVFRHLSVRVEPGVFLPRPETEVVTQAAVDEARRLIGIGREPLVVDLCTGSGVIALSVVLEVPGSRVVAVDVDPAAVALTRANAALTHADGGRCAAGLDPSNARLAPSGASLEPSGASAIRLEVGDVSVPALLADLDGTVDILISNPPYIPDDGVPLDHEVADHDPAGALFGGGTDGLGIPRHVVTVAARLLRPGGLFVMEHADVQGSAVRELVDRTGAFEPAATHRDLTGRDRYVLARRDTT